MDKESGGKSAKETFIFGSWKCRNLKKRRSAASNDTTPGCNNQLEMREKSPFYSKSITANQLAQPQHQQSASLPTTTSGYDSSSSSSSRATTLDRRRHRSNNDTTSSAAAAASTSQSSQQQQRRNAISVYGEQLQEHDFWCPRCSRKMEEPRLLACLHSVCSVCVAQFMSKDYSYALSRRSSRLSTCSSNYEIPITTTKQFLEGCPICDFPLPRYGSRVPPPHYSLQHRLVIYAVRRRLSQRAICCDSCPDEVQATQHCPSCLRNLCQDCGAEHNNNNNNSKSHHQVRPLWEAKSIRHVAVCLSHPSRPLRYLCLACHQVTCKECMWLGVHRGHASEDASSAGARAAAKLGDALKLARTLLNRLLLEYNEGGVFDDGESGGAATSFDFIRDGLHRHSRSRSDAVSTLHSKQARERIREYSRLKRARHLIDAIFIGEELLSSGSDVEILSLKRIVLKRFKFLGVPVDSQQQQQATGVRFNNTAIDATHTGVFHCCTFCSSGGKKEATCACGGTMPGGYKGCGHGHPGHPGVQHWACCGSIYRDGSCLLPRKCSFKITL